MNKNVILKILLAIGFFVCLLKMPYWYYQLIRLLGMIGLLYFAFQDNKERIFATPPIFIISAIVLNPIIKISFSKDIWQIIDMILGVILILDVLFEKKLKKN